MADAPRATVSILKAAALAGVSRSTIYRWLRTDKVAYVRTVGGAVRIFPDTLFRSGNVAVTQSTAA